MGCGCECGFVFRLSLMDVDSLFGYREFISSDLFPLL